MTALRLSPRGETAAAAASAVPGIETCAAVAGLAAIKRPGTELVIWRRRLPPALTAWLDRLEAAHLPDLRVLVRPGELRRAAEPQLDACGLPAGELRDLLLADVEGLALEFSRITQSDLVDLRLERLRDDACWKFHRDCVEARLLTTYRGPTTEWVRPAHAERALREQKRFDGPLERLQGNDVAIFKGSCAGPGSGIVHRSPPIAGSGVTRLLLCLNTRSAASPEPWQHSS